MVLKWVEVIEFTLSPISGEGILIPPIEGQGLSDTRTDDDTLVSGPIMPVMIPIELIIQSSGIKANLSALLDLCCTRSLANSALVEKLGIQLKWLKVPVAFCQLDGSVAGSILAMFVTELVEMQMGSHTETLSFIVASEMECPWVLELAWLKKWNPYLN